MLTIQELKKEIENNQITSLFCIFKYKDCDFLPFQYINAISRITKKDVIVVEELSELYYNKNVLFNDNLGSDTIKVYIADTLEELQGTIKEGYIICKKIKEEKSLSEYIVEVPVLQEWQIKDYAYSNAEGVPTLELDKLVKVCGKDIYRLSSEIDKLRVFTEVERKHLFTEFLQNGVFSDLSRYTIFDLSNAIVKKDITTVTAIYKELDKMDVEPIGLVTVLLNNFRNIIKIQLAKNPSAQSLNMKPGQFWAIKYLTGVYTREQLIFIFEFLTDIDRRIKTGIIPVNSFLIDYIILTILTAR